MIALDIEVEVIRSYDPKDDDELQLRVRGIIKKNVEYLEKGWRKGVINNVSGSFPDNFVRTTKTKNIKDRRTLVMHMLSKIL